jgi:hypothetical protein
MSSSQWGVRLQKRGGEWGVFLKGLSAEKYFKKLYTILIEFVQIQLNLNLIGFVFI